MLPVMSRRDTIHQPWKQLAFGEVLVGQPGDGTL
jgi:hypothetical protein